MGTTLIDNFDYKGKRFLDARQSVATLAELKAVSANDIPDGFRAFVVSEGKWYQYRESNTVDANSGKWRPDNGTTTFDLARKKDISVGKNLFNKDTVTNGVFLTANGLYNSNSGFCTSDYIRVKPGTKYYISNTNTGGADNVWYDGNLTAIGAASKIGVTMAPDNVAYIRLSLTIATIDIVQFEEGESATAYEPFTDDNKNDQRFNSLQSGLNEANSTLSHIEKQLPKTKPGKNLFNPDKAVSGFLYNNGNSTGHSAYMTSEYIAVKGGETITAGPMAIGPIYFCQYDSEKNFIKSTQNNKVVLTVALESNTAYIRVVFNASNYKTEAQVEYGSKATAYEPYRYIISEESLPEEIGNGATPEEVGQIVDGKVFAAKLVLPKRLYFMVGRQNNLYYRQAVKCPDYEDFDFSVSSIASGLKVFDRQLSGIPSAASSSGNKLTLRKFDKVLQELQVTFNTVVAPSSAKTVRILDVGDSITDLGGWQAALKQLLEADNVSVEYVGTMINRVNIGTYQNPVYADNIHGEVQSGGNMSFITEPKGAAKILTVSGITELPVTGYPGTAYIDDNNVSWVVRGFKLTAGADGKYSGKLKLGKFSSDPNYGDGTSDDTSGTGNFPSSGTITKSNDLSGDATIAYTAAVDARYNPFWNPATDELDFQYYFNFWGFSTPDVFIMQWGYNEVGSYEGVGSTNVQTAKSRAKQIIDKFHAQYPGTKIIFGIEIYGREKVGYSGGFANSANGKKFSVLSLAEELIAMFQDNDSSGNPYSGYVTLVPLYAMFDHIYGYGPHTEISLCDLYSGAKTAVGQNGKDGVHPSFADGGLRELARAYEPAVLALI